MNLLPPPTLAEIVEELKVRIAANRKTVEQSKREKLKVQEMVCARTAQELERFVFGSLEASNTAKRLEITK